MKYLLKNKTSKWILKNRQKYENSTTLTNLRFFIMSVYFLIILHIIAYIFPYSVYVLLLCIVKKMNRKNIFIYIFFTRFSEFFILLIFN